MMNLKSKKVLFIISLFLFAFISTGLVSLADEPYAPKVDPPKKMEHRQWWMDKIKKWKIPSKENVGIPPYPGAVIIAVKEASEMVANDKKQSTLPMLTLSTLDEPSKVAAFYKEKLKDWKYDRQLDMFDVFWKGPDEINSLDIRQTATLINVIVSSSSPETNQLMPEAKTKITIVFKTNQ